MIVEASSLSQQVIEEAIADCGSRGESGWRSPAPVSVERQGQPGEEHGLFDDRQVGITCRISW